MKLTTNLRVLLSGIQRRVAHSKSTEFAEEHIASIIRFCE
jgi:hypothetical protein